VSGAGHRLGALTKDLANRWQRTKESWRDVKAEEFERQYLDELQMSVDKAMQVIEQLDKLMTKIRSDCE
jgi:hypothetical protein